MSPIIYILLAAVIGYVLGSLPIGFVLVHLFKGEDLRQKGSGRTGGTNAMRAAGLGVGMMTAFADLAKGAGAIWIVRAVIKDPVALPWAEALGGAMAVVGHNWSIFLGFKGGAGTMPSLGGIMAMWPTFGLALVPFGLVVLLASGYASVGSLSVAAAVPLGLIARAAARAGPGEHVLYGLITCTTVTVALLPNIRRLKQGNERMVGPRAKTHKKLKSKQTI